jgi:hypothetical protein
MNTNEKREETRRVKAGRSARTNGSIFTPQDNHDPDDGVFRHIIYMRDSRPRIIRHAGGCIRTLAHPATNVCPDEASERRQPPQVDLPLRQFRQHRNIIRNAERSRSVRGMSFPGEHRLRLVAMASIRFSSFDKQANHPNRRALVFSRACFFFQARTVFCVSQNAIHTANCSQYDAYRFPPLSMDA